MKGMMKYFPFLILLTTLSSCEKTVQFKLDDVTPKLVVEGSIENGQAPLIYLSRSLDYYSKIETEFVTLFRFTKDMHCLTRSRGSIWPDVI